MIDEGTYTFEQWKPTSIDKEEEEEAASGGCCNWIKAYFDKEVEEAIEWVYEEPISKEEIFRKQLKLATKTTW
eukprot:CAMPEP_0202963544 /NCGR_PEP_ID=MMETSP1396-20130829/7552_1 /ASSEMBLY_ACC=CAM_ASM_000872 /TAXON_ID= /ORGANISM="Pseudokeronopsis sp., Strain Brazil" /LENGTH=72 /DNA_ID=CAMNT_0049684857 /DNA_START=832 /DNA_END=1047 /DNA_ORIENTATION=-